MPSPSRNAVAFVFVPAIIIILAVAVGYLQWRQGQLGVGTVTIGDTLHVDVDIAASDKTRERGLSGRESLAPDHGMLFLFSDPAKYGFWMKEMRFPIDIVWIREGEIVDIMTDVPPPYAGQSRLPTYFPMSLADSVLELPAGYAAEHGLRSGLLLTYVIDRK